MKNFLLSGFVCVVGLNLISIGILFFDSGLDLGGVIVWIGIALSIITLISTIYYWFDWEN